MTGSATTPLVNTFWSGSRLSPVEIACLRSFMHRGIQVRLFSYDAIELPAGIEWVDAGEVLPRESLFHFDGSPAAFSDIFRYKLLRDEGGWWVDTDVVFTGSALPDCSHYWAWQDLRTINNAVLKFPRGDPLCASLLAESQSRATDLTAWGETGPQLLTEFVWGGRQDVHTQSVASTYPVHWLQAYYFWFPELAPVVRRLSAEATFVHLWNSLYARMGLDLGQPVPAGSFLATLAPGHIAPLDAVRRADAVASIRNYLSAGWLPDIWPRIMPPEATLILPDETPALQKETPPGEA
jgi:hypothetical protein